MLENTENQTGYFSETASEVSMGQAKRNKESGVAAKKMRFINLMKKISKYNEEEIKKFLKHRF